MNFGSHSLSHRALTSLSDREVFDEFVVSKQILEDRIGREITSFSYPYGSCTEKLHSACFSAGYKYCYTSSHGIITKDSFILPRNSINSSMKSEDILAILKPSVRTRLLWQIEDSIKNILKHVVGVERYTKIRDKIINDQR